MRAGRIAAIGAGAVLGMAIAGAVGGEPSREDSIRVGKDLFAREWVANDPRSRGGDGLGPVFNARSCVECHHLGGAGGAGPADKNAELATATVVLKVEEAAADVPRDPLIALHPAFKTASSVVLHRQGVRADYAGWRADMTGEHGRFRVATTSRNTPALFGSGRINGLPDSAILARAKQGDPLFPEIRGRAAVTADGKVGRFGWKGQSASLGDFVRTACAVELGLEVPGHPQSPDPRDFDAKAPGPDLSEAECSALTDYLASLPAPGVRPPFDSSQARLVAEGRSAFERVGCASCHAARLGDVEGLYSDLLLHDLGPGLRDSAAYYGTPVPGESLAKATIPGSGPASADEWRTPPLWGLRDSGPYLHDGRAPTLDRAIEAHAGEASGIAGRYRSLPTEGKRQIVAFLNSLAAPKAIAPPASPRPATRRTAAR